MKRTWRGKRTQSAKWNPADYAAHSVVQQTWARELLAKLRLRGQEHILDAGCGDGKVTAEIAQAVPGGWATGVDASPEMIAFAKRAFPRRNFPNLEFRVMDARKLRFARKFDLIFSNAALHWMDNHQRFLRAAGSILEPGGRLVVSCGGKGNARDVFVALRPEMRLKRWRQFFRKMPRPYFFYAPDEYKRWLWKCGFKIRGLRLVPRDAAYAGAEGFAAWLRSTWLPYVQRVPETLRAEFIAAVTQRYVTKHPRDKEGNVHVRMVRLEIDAVKV